MHVWRHEAKRLSNKSTTWKTEEINKNGESGVSKSNRIKRARVSSAMKRTAYTPTLQIDFSFCRPLIIAWLYLLTANVVV